MALSSIASPSLTSPFKYPYPATINVANFVSLKLTQSNYFLWKTHIISLIESQEVVAFVTGNMEIPVEEVYLMTTRQLSRIQAFVMDPD